MVSLKPGEFLINKVNSSTEKILIQDRPDIEAPKRRQVHKEPAGYDGFLVYDDGGYEATEVELTLLYHGGRVDDPAAISTARNRIYKFFKFGQYEFKMTPYFDPEKVYLCILTEAPTFENKWYYNGAMVFKLKIKVQPYKYYVDTIDSWWNIPKAGWMRNPRMSDAKPLFRIIGNGDLDMTVGYKKMIFTGVEGNIYIDCEKHFVYRNENGVITNANHKCKSKDFWHMPSEQSVQINWNGAISTVEMIPRWRDLL